MIPGDGVPSLRWGVIGTGIAKRFVRAVRSHTSQRITAVAARDLPRTRNFAVEHGIETVHHPPSALISDPAVDVVYVATPHSLHCDLALEAIAAGKHVLIEKPIAMSAEEARRITAVGRASNVLVMEAMWTRYLPQSDIIRQVLGSGALGEIHRVTAAFGFRAPTASDHRLWNPQLGGGALLDAGIYPVSFASSILGTPCSISALGAVAPTGVDERADMLLSHVGGASALLSTSLRSVLPGGASIVGSQGRVEVGSPFWGPSSVSFISGGLFNERKLEWHDDRHPTLHESLCYQATAFAAYVAEGRVESPLHPHEEVISIMETLDEARRQVATQDSARECEY
ncbi:Gfo/Idh/MocA family protein [Paenarthrobacter sp. NyZ202]|uniref:Gfo/Idh/MocA family protein n=1 Tax=Paenarthrobacter sp. NyZ202 TaxID=3402689 RepID=UPI003CED5BB1